MRTDRKKRNPQDATLRNVRATKARLDDHGRKINRLRSQVDNLDEWMQSMLATVELLQTQVGKLERAVRDGDFK